MSCDTQIGVKNILLTFTDCTTGEIIRKVSHKLATADLPTIKTCDYVNEALTGGYVRRTHSNAMMSINVIRNTRVPLGFYQGCAAVDIQIEYLNGLIYTAVGGSVTGDQASDTHEVAMELVFKTIEETLPREQFDSVAA